MPFQPEAVVLDVGGVFLLPNRDQIREALARIGHQVDLDESIDRAHYVAVRQFPMDLDPNEWMDPYWEAYLFAYANAVGVHESSAEPAMEHLRNAYVAGALWTHVVPGAKQGLAELAATGVTVGIVSNADGTIEQRLRDLEILQTGPGPGVEVRFVVDSGVVGVEKPDPRIFDYAFDALDTGPDRIWYVGDTPGFDVTSARRAGLTPILLDPFGVNGDYGVATAASLSRVAAMVREAIEV